MKRLHKVIDTVFSVGELDYISDNFKSFKQVNLGAAYSHCHSTLFYEVPEDISKLQQVANTLTDINRQVWNLDLEVTFLTPTLHVYEAKDSPLSKLGLKTHRTVVKRGCLWHYDNTLLDCAITFAVKIVGGEESDFSFIDNEQLLKFDAPNGTGLILASFMPYNINIKDELEMYLFYHLR